MVNKSLLDIEISKLPIEKSQSLYSDYTNDKKSKVIAYLLLFIWCHYFYLGEIWKWILFICTLWWFWFWWIFELFTLSWKINQINNWILSMLLIQYKAIESNGSSNQTTVNISR